MKFVVEQIAIAPRDPARALELLRAIGAEDWVTDLVVAQGSVNGQNGLTNVASLNFNYELGARGEKPLEFEVLHYRAGDNWVDGRNIVSHLGMHCSESELASFQRVMVKFNVGIVQAVETLSHINPAIANSRRYKYVIFGTRDILGVDLKFIVRRDLQPATTA